jgi:hypothetical protein
MTAPAAKALGFGVFALKAMKTPTRETACDANGQPPRENRMARDQHHQKRTQTVSHSRPTRAVDGGMDTAWRMATRLQVSDGVLRPPILD